MDFFFLGLEDSLGSYNKFSNSLIEKCKYKKLFKELNKQLESLGLSVNNAKDAIIDATLVESTGRPDKYMDTPIEDRKEDKSQKNHYKKQLEII